MWKPVLSDWPPAYAPAGEVELLLSLAEGFVNNARPSQPPFLPLPPSAHSQAVPLRSQNPYGGRRALGSGEGREWAVGSEEGAPNAHLLGFVRHRGMGDAARREAAAVFERVLAVREEEHRPHVNAWG